VSYCFFESNHGHSVCDAAAAHAKTLINTTQRDSGRALESNAAVVNLINKMEKAEAKVVEAEDHPGKLPTFHGIRSFHRFEFSNNTVTGYAPSTMKLRFRTWELPKIKFFDENEYINPA